MIIQVFIDARRGYGAVDFMVFYWFDVVLMGPARGEKKVLVRVVIFRGQAVWRANKKCKPPNEQFHKSRIEG